MSSGPTLAEIKSLLQANAASLARQIAPDGARSGKWWLARNPTRDDNNPSFGIGVTGEAPGAWKDFATGEAGDVLQLIAYTQGQPWQRGQIDMVKTLELARGWLGIDGAAPPAAIEKKLRDAAAEEAVRDASAKDKAEKNQRRAKAIYLDSRTRDFLGSPAHAYLTGRGLDVARLWKVPGCLGWLPSAQHYETKTEWPVMVAGISAPDGSSIMAVHRTFLGRRVSDGTWQKAPVSPARKIWPAFKGGAIHLWRGASKLSAKQAAKHGLLETLVLVEGVEDGLAVALSCPDMRVWCAGSLANIGEITLPKCADTVIVCADNDWGKPECQRLLDRGLAALAKQGVEVCVARSPVGKDVNDALVK